MICLHVDERGQSPSNAAKNNLQSQSEVFDSAEVAEMASERRLSSCIWVNCEARCRRFTEAEDCKDQDV